MNVVGHQERIWVGARGPFPLQTEMEGDKIEN